MLQGIRAAMLLLQEGKLLLVRLVDPDTGEAWWVPPGGRLEGRDASVQACAVREVYEETGLQVTVGRLVYYREFVELARDRRWLELYFLAESFRGTASLEGLDRRSPGETFLRELRWMDQAAIRQETVYPEILRDLFWKDVQDGFPIVRYLGKSEG
jgi:8-oxo-dGTP diphosphatase